MVLSLNIQVKMNIVCLLFRYSVVQSKFLAVLFVNHNSDFIYDILTAFNTKVSPNTANNMESNTIKGGNLKVAA